MSTKIDTMKETDVDGSPVAKKKYYIEDIMYRPKVKFHIPEHIGPRMAVILELVKKNKIGIQELCEKSGIKRAGLYKRFAKDDCRLSDYEKLLEVLGYGLDVVRRR